MRPESFAQMRRLVPHYSRSVHFAIDQDRLTAHVEEAYAIAPYGGHDQVATRNLQAGVRWRNGPPKFYMRKVGKCRFCPLDNARLAVYLRGQLSQAFAPRIFRRVPRPQYA